MDKYIKGIEIILTMVSLLRKFLYEYTQAKKGKTNETQEDE